MGKRNRKRKSYGKEFEYDESEEVLDVIDDKGKDGMNIIFWFFVLWF